MKKILTITIALLLMATQTSFAQLIDDAKLKEITGLLKKYELYNQFTIDGNMVDAAYTQNFVSLFDPILFNKLYNDLAASKDDPDAFASAKEYMETITKNYPYGVDVTLDYSQLKIIEPFHNKVKNGYVVGVPKKIAGLYRSKTFFKSNQTCYFFISEQSGDKQPVFKISGILDQAGFQKYQGNNNIKGLYAGLSGSFLSTKIKNSEVENNSDLYQVESQMNKAFALELSYMFNRSFGLGTGVGFASYSTSYTMEYFNDLSSSVLVDIDGDSYTPILKINNLVETDVYETIDIPVLLKFRSGKGKTAFYMDLGIVYSLLSGYYTQEGTSSRSGYYIYDENLPTEWSIILENIPEYDYYSNKSLNTSETDLQAPSGGLSAYAALGLSIPLKHNFYMKVGANYRYGITDTQLGTNSHALGFADFIANPGETFLQAAGIEIGVSYNLSPLLTK
jgi:hypothetical protein